MFDIQNYGSFIAAILIFQAIPGAGTIAILNATARDGIRAGASAVFGTCLGDFVFMTAAVAGLAAIMRTHPVLFIALQWLGAVYLCWMGVQLLRKRVQDESTHSKNSTAASAYFRQAFLVSLTNPKVVLFFVAFFPLFLRTDSTPLTLGAMMVHVTLLSLIYQIGLVLVGNFVANRLRSQPSARRIATRLAGFALIAFGLKLAANNR